MGYGEGVVQCVGVVQQHVGVHAEHAHGEGAAALALVLVHVHPVLRKGPIEELLILLAQGLGGALHQRLHVLEGHREVHVLHHGRVQVKDIDLLETQHPLPQLQILLHGGQALVDRLDQAVVDADGHVALVQRRLTGGGIAPDRGLVVVHLHRAAVEGREGLPVLPIGAEHGPERLLPDLPAAALPEHAEVALGELDLVPLLVVDLGQLHIHVGEHGIGVGGRLGRVAQHGQHPLPRFVQDVGAAPGDVRHDEPVHRHVIFSHPGGEVALGDGQNLRVHKG